MKPARPLADHPDYAQPGITPVGVVQRGDGRQLRAALGADGVGRPVLSLRLWKEGFEGLYVPEPGAGFSLRRREILELLAILQAALALFPPRDRSAERGEGPR